VLIAGAGEDGGRAKTALTSKPDTAIRKQGALVRFAPLSDAGLAKWVRGEATRAGKEIEDAAVELLIRASHGNRATLACELEKAICYAGDARVVSLAAVEATCSYDPEDVMFRLVDAVSARNADRAL